MRMQSLAVSGALGLVCALGGCADPDLGSLDTQNATIADLLVSTNPAVLDFGHVEALRSRTLEVTIANVGTRDLRLLSAGIDRESAFSFEPLSQTTLTPGQAIVVPVTYAPTAFSADAANLTIETNDPLLPRASVGLAGRCDPPRLALSPPVYDFGIAYIGCSVEQPLYLENLGDGALQVSGLNFVSSSADIELDVGENQVPFSLGPGEKTELLVRYRPLDVGEDEASLVLESNDPEQPRFEGALLGSGLQAGEIRDLFKVSANGMVDILFVIDNSGSMMDNQETLASNFKNFYDIVEALKLNWQIGVVTTDNGVLQGSTRIITSDTPDVKGTFSENALVGAGGSGWERGLEFAYRALSEPLVSNQNAGFLRKDAGLRIIFLSDEEEQSEQPVDFYVSYFQNLKVNPAMVQLNAIVGEVNGCTTSCGEGYPTVRYPQAVLATGGVQASICECDFIEALEVLAEESQVFQDTFPLTQDPVVETIKVEVDGTLSSDWTYDAKRNTVVFNSPEVTPRNGETVTIIYDLLVECSD